MSEQLFQARCGTMRIAVPMASIREILPLLPIRRSPGLPRPLVGFVAVRGQAVALLSPLMLLDAEATLDPIDLSAHLIWLRETAGRGAALLVDRVDALGAPDMVRTLDPARSPNAAISGEAVFGETVAHLLLPDRLLAEAEAVALVRLTAEADRRLDEWTQAEWS